MTSVLGLVFLVIIAIVGKYLLDKIDVKKIGFSFLIYSGFYYLLLGIFSNPNLLNILDLSVLKKAEFFFDFVLGWTGFLVGLQLNFKGIKRFPKKYYTISILHFIIAFLVISLFFYGLDVTKIIHLSKVHILLLSTIGSMGSVLTIALLVKKRTIRSVNAHFLQFITAFDNVIGIIVLGVLFFIYQLSVSDFNSAIRINGFSYLIVVLLAFFYKYLHNAFKSLEEEALLIIGLILIVVGVAQFLHNSILFLSFLLGALIINMKVDTKKILMTVQEWEKPLNFILLFTIGLHLDFGIIQYGPLFLAFIVIMLIAKYIAGDFYQRFRLHHRHIEKENKLVLYGMSSLSLAMALDAYFTNYNPVLLKLLTIIVLSFYFTNFMVFYFVKQKRQIN